ncbi:MAG: 16S rRNA (guanine(527)-N(7))-methyltransferase RsmG [Dysgonamonadaceae bacterium]|jgi:16S rRNA (guanine527-N7)-methyltransferase|nr:16S rRNA (guanine(527)-N(7))-methyltransferase RsmG [Dysgonamonadaceae bacterium]
MELIKKYFPEITTIQEKQFAELYNLYIDWNSKINVISRKDIENLYEHHVLHSLGISKVIRFKAGSSIMDVGTGGGFPGIPLAILFPDVSFHLIDSIGKKITVAKAVADAIGLQNTSFRHGRAEEEKGFFDFVVSRAVMPLENLVKTVKKNIAKKQQNALPNGIICLKGGELEREILPFRNIALTYPLETYFSEDYFSAKKAVYIPLA